MNKFQIVSNINSLDRINQKAIGSLQEWGITELEKFSGERGDCWKCPMDQCIFFSEDLVCLKTHYLKEHNARPYVCQNPDCTWSFPTKSKLNRHCQAHELRKSFKCQFEYCRKLFKTTSNLKQHIKKVHKSARLACDFDNCALVFHNQKTLECHRSTHVGAIPEYSCEIATCEKLLFTKSGLRTHMKMHERKADDLLCKICGKQFDIPCRFKSHLLTHEITKPYQCQEMDCTFSFLSQSKLNRHMETHSEIRKFPCSFQGCSKAFKRKEHLNDHERSLHIKKLKSKNVWRLPHDFSPVKSDLESEKEFNEKPILNNTSTSSSSDQSLEDSPSSGSARTSLAYRDIIQGKLTIKTNISNSDIASSRNKSGSRSKVVNTNNMETLQGDAAISVEQDLMLSSTNLPDSSSLSLQEELLSQEYFLLDPSNRLSDFEPSTINLRDLE